MHKFKKKWSKPSITDCNLNNTNAALDTGSDRGGQAS
jgi:hypothetical protein